MRKCQIRKDTGGIIWYDCPEGRPTTATIGIKTPDNAALPTPVSGAAATVDSVSTTVTSWSASAPDEIVVGSVTGILVDRQYRATNAKGEHADVKVRGIVGSTKTVYLYDDCPIPLANADTFVGTRLSYAVTAGNAATADLNYRATWGYTIGTTGYTPDTVYDVVRMLLINRATESGLRMYRPSLISKWRVPATGDGCWSQRIEQAWEEALLDIEQRHTEAPGAFANALVDQGQLEFLVYERVLYDMADEGMLPPGGGWTGDEWRKKRWLEYQDKLSQFDAKIVWVDADGNAAVGTGEEGTSFVFPRARH